MSGRGSRPPVASAAGLAARLARAWWRQLAALVAACAVVAATIAGAVGVGEALRDGLKKLALERLGGVDTAIVGDDVFTAGLVRDLALPGAAIEPAVVLEVTYESTAGDTARGTLLACESPGRLGFEPAPPTLGADEVAINDVLARALGAKAGDSIVLRVAKRSAVPADSPLGRRIPESLGRRVRVAAVLPARGIGRFALSPAQVTGGTGLVTLATAQALLGRGDVANAGLVAGAVDAPALRAALVPALADYGLVLEEVGGGAVRLSSRALLLPAEVDRAAGEVLGPAGGVPTLAFLANALVVPAAGDAAAAEIPYSTILGTDATTLPVGGLVGDDGAPIGPIPDDGIVIDRWMADDFAAQGRPVSVGDSLDLRFFRPETLHGRLEEATETLRIVAIARMEGAAVAPSLVPEVEGITDEKSIADWDPPFPFDRSRVRTVPPHDEDDRYWKDHGTTPKAFVSLPRARRMAAARFGATTAWFVPVSADRAGFAARLAANLRPERLGIRVEEVRARALDAARGSTPFGSLFLALSSFVVVAGLLLEWLLFHLLVAARRRDVGLLSAVGWPPRRIAWLLGIVGAAAAALGIALGTAVGPAWARLLLDRLAASWNASVAAGSAAAFGDGAIAWTRLWPGAAAALVLSLAALAWGAARAARRPPLSLLRGAESAMTGGGRTGRVAAAVSGLALVGAVVAAAAGARADAQGAVGMFFLSGALALAGLLAIVRLLLGRAGARRGTLRSLGGLAWRGIAARPGRAFTIAAIVAVAEFLVVAVSAFSLAPPADPRDRAGPTGGFTSIASFASPSSVDPADPAALDELGLDDAARAALAGAEVVRLRASSGDDASCTNLYAPTRPVVLGAGPGFVERGGFRFTGHLPLPADAAGNPWRLLGRRGDGPIPAILDDATSRWALKYGGPGARFTLPDDEGTPVEFEVVGLLEPGILQGWVIVAEADFERVFPGRSGYSMALVDAGRAEPSAVDRAVRAAWVDAGATVEPALDRLRRLSAVQNTFLSAFQALGTLGLLLGTAGVAAVQVQGVLERTGAFGLLGAVGFPLSRIRAIVLIETLLMVGLGLAAGAAAGALTLPAHVAGGRASVPLFWIGATCAATLLVAVLAGLAATRAVARLEPKAALASRS